MTQWDVLHFTIAILMSILAILAYRLLDISLRRRKRASRRDSGEILLVDALRDQNLRQREALQAKARSDMALQALGRLHATILEHLPVGVAVLEAGGSMAYGNVLFSRFLASQTGLADQIGVWFERLRSGDLAPAAACEWEGADYLLAASFYELPDQQWLILLRDLTQVRKLEEQLRIRRDLVVMGELSSGIAHEVKNALAVIQGHIQMAAYGDLEEHSELAMQEIRRLLRCVREFMNSSQDRGAQLEPLNLSAWLNQQRGQWQRLAGDDRISLTLPERVCWVSGDADMLTVLSNNLIINGLEAARAGQADHAEVQVRLTVAKSWAKLAVSDNGPGFTAAMRKKLFVPFVTTKEKGSGLGLFHCRKLAMEHGGRLELSSDQPTTMLLTLPLIEAPAAEQASLGQMTQSESG